MLRFPLKIRIIHFIIFVLLPVCTGPVRIWIFSFIPLFAVEADHHQAQYEFLPFPYAFVFG